MTHQVVVATTIPSTGLPAVAWWLEVKRGGTKTLHWECVASIYDGSLQIGGQCPDEWMAGVWAAFELVRAGGVPVGSHSVSWPGYGRDPVFTVLDAEVTS